MKILSKSGFENARHFIMSSARSLEQALFSHAFENGSTEECLAEIASFQSPTGGFTAIESDFAGDVTTVLNATHALEMLTELGTPQDHPLISSTLKHLNSEYDESLNAWPIIPEHDNSQPHAPWWHYDSDFGAKWNFFIDNPRPKILSFSYRYPGHIDRNVQETVYHSTVSRISQMKTGTITRDSLDCFISLFECEATPQPLRVLLKDAIAAWLQEIMEQNPGKWQTYCMKPIDAITSPQSPYYEQYRSAVEANLDYEIEMQEADGSWNLTWDWAGTFPEAWERAERHWKGLLTLKNLQVLDSFGRIADG